MFKIGDKVRCINPEDILNKGETYIITYVYRGADGNLLVKLKGISYTGYYAHRFVHANPEYASITPVIRKIREMEERRRVSYAAI